MPKKYLLTEKQFNKMRSTAKEISDLLAVSKCFMDKYLLDSYEIETILPVFKYIERNTDNLMCMFSYIETKDEELKDVF